MSLISLGLECDERHCNFFVRNELLGPWVENGGEARTGSVAFAIVKVVSPGFFSLNVRNSGLLKGRWYWERPVQLTVGSPFLARMETFRQRR